MKALSRTELHIIIMSNMKAKQMKKTLSVFLSLFFALAVFAGCFSPASAAGTTQISFSQASATVGDSFTVSVKASASSSITLNFSSNYVTLTDAGGGATAGNAVSFTGTKITCRFTAAAAGKADFIVSSSDGAVSGSSASMTVAASAPAETPAAPAETPAAPAESPAAPAETPETPAETPAETPTDTAAAPANADLSFNGQWYAVSERYSDSQIPAGFTKTQVAIGNKTFNELSNGTYTVLYMKPVAADGTIAETGSFFLYDAAAGTVTSPFEFIGTKSSYVIAVDPADNPYSDILTQASFDYTSGDSTVTIDKAYTLTGSGEGFYYIYGVDENGTAGWYIYSAADGTVQTADTTLLDSLKANSGESSEDEPETPDAPKEGTTSRNIRILKIVLVVVIALVVLLIVLNLLPRGKKADDDEYGDDDFDEPGAAGEEGSDTDIAAVSAALKERADKAAEAEAAKDAAGKKVPEQAVKEAKKAAEAEKTKILPNPDDVKKAAAGADVKSAAEADTKTDAIENVKSAGNTEGKTEAYAASNPTGQEAVPETDAALTEQEIRQREEEKSRLDWARQIFFNGKTGTMPSDDELFYGAGPLEEKPGSGLSESAKGKKGGKKGGSDSGSGGDGSDGGSSIDVMDLNDL